jgi:taurine transport system ATP-binding protein
MLSVDQVSVWFRGTTGKPVKALDNVSFDLANKGIVVLLGASGCGKSTLLNAIAGFLPVSEGRITLDGKAITKPGADRGVVFQKDTLLPWLSVAENVGLGLAYGGANKSQQNVQAQTLLELVGLKDFAGAKTYELSGGMRQRVGIARALATDPRLLLMDEPFGALDSLTREQMQELLVSVWKETGKSILLITHSIEEALFLGTEVLVMSPRPGRVIARYKVDFVNQFAQSGNALAIKSSPEFVKLREAIRSQIHSSDELKRSAA